MTPNEVEALALEWRYNPVAFCQDVLGFDPWEDPEGGASQAAVLRAVPNNLRITVRSGHKVGKSRAAAAIALWAWCMLDDCRVVLTAPVFQQVKEVLWREIRKLYTSARIPLGPANWLAISPQTGLRHPNGNQIFGRAVDTPESFSGISGKNVVYIVDEASGVPEEIFEAIEGNRAGGAWVIMFSNPTQVTGTFYESHTVKAHFWKTFHIDSERVAKVANPAGQIPGLATIDWVNEKKAEWGVDSVAYAVRVRGDFPSQTTDRVFSLNLVQLGQRAWSPLQPVDLKRGQYEPLSVGVDVARFGDDETVAYARRGKWVSRAFVLKHGDGALVVNKLLRWLKDDVYILGEPLAFGMTRPTFYVDAIGVGASVVDILRLRKHRVVEVNGGHKAIDSDNYFNARTEAMFAAAKWVKAGGMIPLDGQLKADLLAPRFKFDARGRFQLESKDDTKKRLGRSPDRGDAFAYAVYGQSINNVQRGTLKIGALSV